VERKSKDAERNKYPQVSGMYVKPVLTRFLLLCKSRRGKTIYIISVLNISMLRKLANLEVTADWMFVKSFKHLL
jgi:hypothetical protein